MLRITTQVAGTPESPRIRFILEGKLSGAWVAELERVWQARRLAASSVTLDLRGLDYISPAGKELLCRLKGSGAELLAGGLCARSVVAEILKLAAVVLILVAFPA